MHKSDLNFTPHQLNVIKSDSHIALTANAGSGKTFVLKYKYLNAAKKLNGDVSKIAAITFTNKAANELYKKIAEVVNSEIASTDNQSQLRVLHKIRRNLVSAYISTIHSFCIEILKNYPVEAGVDANFIPIDPSTTDELIELSISEVLDSLFKDDGSSSILKELLRYFGTRNKLESEFRKLLNQKKNVILLKNNIYNKSVNEISELFNKSFYSLLEEIKKIYSRDFIKLLEDINNIVFLSDGSNENVLFVKQACEDFNKNQDLFLLLTKIKEIVFTKAGSVRIKGYFPNKLKDNYSHIIDKMENLFSRLKILTENEIDLSLHYDLAILGKNILFVFDHINSSYELKKRKNSYLDFDDILIKTKILLENENVRKELSSKFTYLMVDEYQDTDEIQYNIFLPILDDLRSGNLFIVGDDKQSIYRFRDADLKVFDKTRKDISEHNRVSGLQLLPDSFRMAKELCLFTNYIFNRLFHSSIPLFNELKNVPIVCAKDENELGEIEFLVSSEDEQNSQSQPELTALRILDLVYSGKHSFSQIAVLVTKRKHFDELETIFTIKRIPYKIIGGRGFFQRQVISDIRNYLSFISNPNDDVSLVAILRSPFFMISDSEIFKISLSAGSSFFEKLKNYSVLNKNFLDIILKLETHIKKCSSLPISRLIREILSETDFLLIVKNRHNGEQELANIEKLLSIAKDFDEFGFKTLYDFVKFLDDSLKNNPDEAQAEGLLSDSGVQLMTIHQAKGLEFPVVFLYRCEASPETSSNKAREISINKELGLLFKILPKDNPLGDLKIPPLLLINNFIEDAKDLAEVKRLLYVGITRAINKLYVVYNKNDKEIYDQKSFISLLKNVFPVLSNNIISIEEDVKFLKKKDNEYYNVTNLVKANIKITSYIEEGNIKVETDKECDKQYSIDTQKIESESESQIISATKISTFEKCPLKYHLTYNIGLAKLLKLLPSLYENRNKLFGYLTDLKKQDKDEDILYSEKNIISDKSSEKFGQIIHKILEKNIPLEKMREFLSAKEILSSKELKDEEYINNIISLLENYYNSKIFEELSKYKNYKNEFEILIKENNVILKGIIDKIIFNDDSILIIDYKTDYVNESHAHKHYLEYEIQMKFYLYISMKFFEKINIFSSRLIFLRNPNLYFDLNYERGNLSNLKNEIFSLVRGIIDNNSDKNLKHCPNCIYFINNQKCIIT